MLDVLDITEDFQEIREKHSNTPSETFCSTTTLRAVRLTVNSDMALAEDAPNYYYIVLSGKWNQDPVEVFLTVTSDLFPNLKYLFLQRFFGKVRSIDNTPTAHSWLQIFKASSLHNFAQTVNNNANVDNEDELKILVGYKICLVDQFKDIDEKLKQAKLSLRDQ